MIREMVVHHPVAGKVQGLVFPETGEVALLDSPLQVAEWLLRVKELEAALRDAKRFAYAALDAHVDSCMTGVWKQRFGPYMVTSEPPGTAAEAREFDPEALREGLRPLLPAEVLESLVKETVTLKVNLVQLRRIGKVSPEVREVIAASVISTGRDRKAPLVAFLGEQ